MSSIGRQMGDAAILRTRSAGSSRQHKQSPKMTTITSTFKKLKTTEAETLPPPAPSRSVSSEIQIADDYELLAVDGYTSSPMSMSEGSPRYSFSDSHLITSDVEDNENLMKLKLEAMTWAAMAKDFAISSLEKRLRKALQIAKAEQVKNAELQSALDKSQHELSRAKVEIIRLEEAEERLAREHGESQVDAMNFAAERAKLHAEEVKQHRAQLLMLEHRIRLMLGEKGVRGQMQDRYSQDAYWEWQGSDAEILEQELEKSQERERSLSAKYSEAAHEIEELKTELADAETDLRISEVLRKTQSRRLKVLERERRHLIRRGALRAVKLAPKTQPKQESPTPAGGSEEHEEIRRKAQLVRDGWLDKIDTGKFVKVMVRTKVSKMPKGRSGMSSSLKAGIFRRGDCRKRCSTS